MRHQDKNTNQKLQQGHVWSLINSKNEHRHKHKKQYLEVINQRKKLKKENKPIKIQPKLSNPRSKKIKKTNLFVEERERLALSERKKREGVGRTEKWLSSAAVDPGDRGFGWNETVFGCFLLFLFCLSKIKQKHNQPN